MSFGFSVSDFVALGALALKLYHEFRDSPAACRNFANELLLFHRILEKTASELQDVSSYLEEPNYAALNACADSCKELIYVQIYGATSVPCEISTCDFSWQFTPNPLLGPNGAERMLKAWRHRWAERKFAARIPELQRAVTAHVQSLIAFNTLIARSDQLRLFACQDRLQALHEQTQAYLQGTHTSITSSQTRLEAASERLEESQEKMERQLQSILAFQQRRENPILSQSLDASSPEGRETWMNLGRLLRTEGITPAMIKQNRDVLVKAMKTTLKEEGPSSTPESYQTAFESFSIHHRTFTDPSGSRPSAHASLNLLGSAPPCGATFTNDFLARQNRTAGPLDQDINVQDGLQSLVQGMDSYQVDDKPIVVNQYDDLELEGLSEAHAITKVETTAFSLTVEQGLPYLACKVLSSGR